MGIKERREKPGLGAHTTHTQRQRDVVKSSSDMTQYDQNAYV